VNAKNRIRLEPFGGDHGPDGRVCEKALRDETLHGKTNGQHTKRSKQHWVRNQHQKRNAIRSLPRTTTVLTLMGRCVSFEIIQRKFKWKDQVNVFAINASWRETDMEAAFDEVPFGDADDMQAYMQTLDLKQANPSGFSGHARPAGWYVKTTWPQRRVVRFAFVFFHLHVSIWHVAS